MPRSPERNREIREHSRQNILTAALHEFGEHGYEATTLTDITRRAGVSQGLANYYFGSKQQLIEDVLDSWLGEVLAIAQVDGTADQRLATIIDATLRTAVTVLPQQRMILTIGLQPSTHHILAAAEQRNAETVELFEDAIRSIFAERGAADPALEEVMLRSVLEGVIVKLAVYENSYPVEHARRWLYGQYSLPAPAEALLPEGRLNDEDGIARLRATATGTST